MTDLADPVAASDEHDALGAPLTVAPGPGAALPPPAGPSAGAVATRTAPPPPPPVPQQPQQPALQQPVPQQPVQSTQYLPPETPQYRPPAPQPVQPAMPSVPPVAAAMPPTAHQPIQPGALPDYTAIAANAAGPAQKKRKSLVGRFFKTLFVLALLGGIAAAGVVYGPTALEKYREYRDGEVAAPDEPEAPLAFPIATAPSLDVRNATFVLEDTDPESDETTRRYEITTDFETKITRVVIERSELPTLEVLTFLDMAVVRRMGDDAWYRTPRGQFPLDDQMERTRWVRYVDELIPLENRAYASIESSTTSDLAGERMRRLRLSIDPTLLGGPELTTDSFDSPPIVVGPATNAPDLAGAPTDRAVPALDPTGATRALPTDQAAPVPPPPPGAGTPVSLEIWIDARGLIRQLVSSDVLGDETLTVTSVSPDEWVPVFPQEEQVQPLTASALVDLGL